MVNKIFLFILSVFVLTLCSVLQACIMVWVFSGEGWMFLENLENVTYADFVLYLRFFFPAGFWSSLVIFLPLPWRYRVGLAVLLAASITAYKALLVIGGASC